MAMDRVWPRLLTLLGAPDCRRRSFGSEATKQESFPHAEGFGELECDYGEWKYYAFPASIFLALLIFITLSYFYSKYQGCGQLCGCWDSHAALEDDYFDIPWEPNLIEYPEPYSICVTPPQSISGRSTCRSKALDQVSKEDIRLPFAPKDLGKNSGQDPNFQTFQEIVGAGSLSETLGTRASLGSSSDDLFTIEDLE